jgi:predicted nucleic acid-binding protein
MARAVFLDSGPLGMISHPRPDQEIVAWATQLMAAGNELLIPEIADYEVRRELLRARKIRGIRRLDDLRAVFGFVPLNSDALLRAAEFWAEARRRGRPTASDESLDADVILAGQAATFDAEDVIVATSNPKHLSHFVATDHWQNIT